ncbi:MAG: alpha/beta fold hydrolase [Candidatus Didemnitutus sp.]|nr:alpha/beta fold hydrolase [Candidatus Didemnitutus sp.]
MPLLDLPLPKLRRYRGRNPRPRDFDRYWSDALAELDATPPQPEFIRVDALRTPGVECFDLRFTGVGGARLHAKFLRPTRRGRRSPAVLNFHGYGANSADWSTKLPYVHAGMCVAALDCRGQGGSSDDPGGTKGPTLQGHIVRGLDDPDARKLFYRAQFLDTAQLARVVMARPEVDPHRVGAFGLSQGGALTLACAALEPRLKLAAPVYPFLSDYQRVWEMDLAKDAYGELREFFRQFDPRHERERAIFTKLGYIDVQHLAPRVRARVLMFTALDDNITPPSTQFAIYNRLRAPKEMRLYPDFGHETLPGEADATFNFLLQL